MERPTLGGKEFPQQIYDVQTRRHRIYDYGAYVADRYTQEFFADLAAEIESVASEERWTQADIAAFASRFVQSYPYTSDSVSTGYNNYPRYPIETVVDETGDCEDTSLLLAAILYMLDYRVALLEFDSHLGVGVELRERPGNITFNGIPYTYIEPDGIPAGTSGGSRPISAGRRSNATTSRIPRHSMSTGTGRHAGRRSSVAALS